ncbi:MAG: hypothetical protein IT380_24140 [Myxococcales bacterium]|nr:hypothetical protein [Myxococcales bacterium]
MAVSLVTLSVLAFTVPVNFQAPAFVGGGGGVDFTGAPASKWSCGVCHGPLPSQKQPTLRASITASGRNLDAEGYAPGETYPLEVSVTEAAKASAIALEVVDAAGAPAGTLSVAPPAPGMEAEALCPDGFSAVVEVSADGRVAHSNACREGLTRWRLAWTAPATDVGQVTLYFSAVAGNGDGTNLEDAAVSLVVGLPSPTTPKPGGCAAVPGSALAWLVLVLLLRRKGAPSPPSQERAGPRRCSLAGVLFALLLAPDASWAAPKKNAPKKPAAASAKKKSEDGAPQKPPAVDAPAAGASSVAPGAASSAGAGAAPAAASTGDSSTSTGAAPGAAAESGRPSAGAAPGTSAGTSAASATSLAGTADADRVASTLQRRRDDSDAPSALELSAGLGGGHRVFALDSDAPFQRYAMAYPAVAFGFLLYPLRLLRLADGGLHLEGNYQVGWAIGADQTDANAVLPSEGFLALGWRFDLGRFSVSPRGLFRMEVGGVEKNSAFDDVWLQSLGGEVALRFSGPVVVEVRPRLGAVVDAGTLAETGYGAFLGGLTAGGQAQVGLGLGRSGVHLGLKYLFSWSQVRFAGGGARGAGPLQATDVTHGGQVAARVEL